MFLLLALATTQNFMALKRLQKMKNGIIPHAKFDLEAKFLEMDVDLGSSLVPTVARKLGYTDIIFRNRLIKLVFF